MQRLRAINGLDIVRHMSSAIAETGGAVPISDLGVAARASSTYLAKRFKDVIGVTPKRLARSYRFTATVLAINVAAPIDWGDVAGCFTCAIGCAADRSKWVREELHRQIAARDQRLQSASTPSIVKSPQAETP